MLADGLEDGEEMSDAEQVADRWPHVIDLQFAARGFGVDVQADQRAEATAIHMCYVLKIKNDAGWTGQQLANLGIEQMIQAGNQSSVAMNDDAIFIALNGEGQTMCGLAGHSVACDAQDYWRRNCDTSPREAEEPSPSDSLEWTWWMHTRKRHSQWSVRPSEKWATLQLGNQV